ncbi:MAG: hypothetical protein VXU50_04185 [Verrucomicrobiota bacterium]|nr:hypothetical protein [Verrucomicrobiota bacterium]
MELQKSHEKKLAAMEKQLEVLRWEASEASKKERARAEELKRVSKMVGQLKGKLKWFVAEVEGERLKRQIDMEHMSRAVDEIAEGAADAAAEKIEGEMSKKVAALQKKVREEKRLRDNAEKKAKAQADQHAAETARLVAGVQGLLEDTRGEVASEMGATVLEAQAQAEDLTNRIQELESGPASLIA